MTRTWHSGVLNCRNNNKSCVAYSCRLEQNKLSDFNIDTDFWNKLVAVTTLERLSEVECEFSLMSIDNLFNARV